MNTITTKQITSVIRKLPHTEGRVPYTYHHDYLRNNCPALSGWSRADIANSTVSFDSKELYAFALCQIIDEAYSCDIALTQFTDEDRQVIRKCMVFSEERMSFYQAKFADSK